MHDNSILLWDQSVMLFIYTKFTEAAMGVTEGKRF